VCVCLCVCVRESVRVCLCVCVPVVVLSLQKGLNTLLKLCQTLLKTNFLWCTARSHSVVSCAECFNLVNVFQRFRDRERERGREGLIQ